ncbi:hypothetical protein [Lichenibacterium ramalinae]|uniref:Cell envelope biogenesis protein TolA n=1 Tax=Lichenibacterium ramalinae TaxID=2316527 RepID=A0A4Q2R869_9HYPH|nr:hypothetical protein [Lichenibacterium ramalinae]RYB01943.1 hypothetical protein D3272_23235 [Lichenibacterium ramalinae]
MTQATGRRLKVFQTHLGFFDTVVAAPSQAAALRAWGTHQNLFADGQARVTDDPQAVEAALAHPEVPLKRAVGSGDPFARESVSLPKVPDAPRRTGAKPSGKPSPPPKPPPDRSALDAAEAALRNLDDERKSEETDFRRRQDELDAERRAAQASYVERHKAAAQALLDARTAYGKAGRA